MKVSVRVVEEGLVMDDEISSWMNYGERVLDTVAVIVFPEAEQLTEIELGTRKLQVGEVELTEISVGTTIWK